MLSVGVHLHITSICPLTDDNMQDVASFTSAQRGITFSWQDIMIEIQISCSSGCKKQLMEVNKVL